MTFFGNNLFRALHNAEAAVALTTKGDGALAPLSQAEAVLKLLSVTSPSK